MEASITQKCKTLRELKASGWRSKSVKDELHDNLLRGVAGREQLFPGIIGYDSTVIPETIIASAVSIAGPMRS